MDNHEDQDRPQRNDGHPSDRAAEPDEGPRRHQRHRLSSREVIRQTVIDEERTEGDEERGQAEECDAEAVEQSTDEPNDRHQEQEVVVPRTLRQQRASECADREG
ncbi:hypothetical protein D9M72_427990 [compost metagenome]